jgi:hypothetical protein
MSNRIRNHIRANVLGFLALFLVLSTGSAVALNGSNTVFSDDIVNGEVKTPDLGANAVASGKIADGQVTTADLGANSVSAGKIAGNAVNSSKVADNSLTGVDIDESTLALGETGGSWKLSGNAGTTGSDFLGTTDSKPLNLRVNNARGLRLEPASDGTNQSPNVIGGIADNAVFSGIPGVYAATIAGGGRSDPSNPATANKVTDNYGTVGGGANNQAGDASGTPFDASSGTVSGGVGNTASGFASIVPGGAQNAAGGNFSLAAGRRARVNSNGAFVWADSNNFDFASTAPNQFNVRSTGGARLVSGIDGSGSPTTGLELPAGTSAWSTLANGQPFDLRVNGARGLRIDPASDGINQSPNVIGGTADNSVTAGVFAATIGGGGRSSPPDAATANRVTDDYGTVGGGADNQAGDGGGSAEDGELATVGGGLGNTASQIESTIGGGFSNTASGFRATVAGGEANVASGEAASIGGGQGNTASGIKPTVGGGVANSASDTTATVSGGKSNVASGEAASIGGGFGNTANEIDSTIGGGFSNAATGFRATVGGGNSNGAGGNSATVGGGVNNVAFGTGATVPGGDDNTAQGNYSLAAGRHATASHNGAFVWADSSSFDFASTAQDQFSVRATGGARFVSAINGSTGAPTAGVTLAPGGGSWASLSDQASKTAVTPASGRAVLRKLSSVPVSKWSYRSQDDSIRHIGPMAQDFYRAFGIGEDRKHIDSVDADGVALAAIKGLHRELRAERRHRRDLERRMAGLEARLAALERGGAG